MGVFVFCFTAKIIYALIFYSKFLNLSNPRECKTFEILDLTLPVLLEILPISLVYYLHNRFIGRTESLRISVLLHSRSISSNTYENLATDNSSRSV
jgi:uncharacterized membrane protein